MLCAKEALHTVHLHCHCIWWGISQPGCQQHKGKTSDLCLLCTALQSKIWSFPKFAVTSYPQPTGPWTVTEPTIMWTGFTSSCTNHVLQSKLTCTFWDNEEIHALSHISAGRRPPLDYEHFSALNCPPSPVTTNPKDNRCFPQWTFSKEAFSVFSFSLHWKLHSPLHLHWYTLHNTFKTLVSNEFFVVPNTMNLERFIVGHGILLTAAARQNQAAASIIIYYRSNVYIGCSARA